MSKPRNRGKLDEDQVIAIYESTKSTAEVAAKFNINPEEVTRIRKGKAYKHFTEDLKPNAEFPFKPGTFTIT